MKQKTLKIIDSMVARYPELEPQKRAVVSATELLCKCYENGGKLLICGNGGSASDALHIVGELMKDFCIERPLGDEIKNKIAAVSENAEYICSNLQVSLPAVALVGSAAIETAFANDRAPDLCFAQQVMGLGNKGDILLGISTSGNSKNIIYALDVAKAKGLKTIALTGKGGGKMATKCDVLIDAPETETYKVQELHLPIYHAICLAVENEFFGE